jgi:hypothetical protein
MLTNEQLAAFDAQMKKDQEAIDAAQNGPYATAVKDLLHLSGDAETEGTIAVIPSSDYSALISLVEKASASNLSQAQLVDRIRKLGNTAVHIAKKIESLAPLLA